MKNRRRKLNYAIKREMQLRLLLSVMVIVLVAVGLTSGFFYFLSNREVGQTYRQFHVNAKNFLEILLPGVIIAFVLGIISATGMAVFFPHRIAGPLHRMENDLKEKLGEGNLTVRFSVRKGDEVGELAAALNITVDKLREKIERIGAATEELKAAVKVVWAAENNKRLVEEAKRL
ncbi:MAG: methyl-accepting chemotaxis protein, partial [Deltaproteobacteria bacterium]|nr:methyl-accepting chemotaxis protein [Deltaproteobacteria bacterium]